MIPLHRVRFELGEQCWIDIEAALGEGGSTPSEMDAPRLLSAEVETRAEDVSSGSIPPMCWRDAGHLFERFQLREDTDYFVDIATPYSLEDAVRKTKANPAWPFSGRLASAFVPEPPRRWRRENGKTVVTGQLRLRSHAGILNLEPEFGGQLRVEVACRKFRYFEEFKELLDSLADKAAELLLSYDSPVSLSFETTDKLVTHEAALHFILRHVMSESRLPVSIEEILERPHCKLVDRVEIAPIEEVADVDAELLADGLDYSELGRGGPLSRLFRGYTPSGLPQRESFESLDTPENRYAKAFLEQCSLLARRLEEKMAGRKKKASEREARGWSMAIDEALQHDMWRDVGPLTQIPANSQVLLRKRGYKDLFPYDLSLRMALALDWGDGTELAEGLSGDIRPVSQIYEYWCFFTLREILLEFCTETKGGNFISVSADGLRVELRKGRQSECRFEFADAEGRKAQLALFYNKRFIRPGSPRANWDGSYTAKFDPDFSVRVASSDNSDIVHWLHFDAKYRLQRQEATALFDGEDETVADGEEAVDYRAEIRRVHKQEDLYKMHTYRDGILGSRGAYVLFPGDGVGGDCVSPKPNFFVRNPAAFGGVFAQRVPSVGVFDLAPGGSPAQGAAIAELLRAVLESAASGSRYNEESGIF